MNFTFKKFLEEMCEHLFQYIMLSTSEHSSTVRLKTIYFDAYIQKVLLFDKSITVDKTALAKVSEGTVH